MQKEGELGLFFGVYMAFGWDGLGWAGLGRAGQGRAGQGRMTCHQGRKSERHKAGQSMGGG